MKFATIVVSLGTVISMSVIEEGLLRSATSKVGEFYTSVLNALITALFLFITAMVPALYVFFLMIRTTGYFGARDLVPILLLFAVCSVLGTHFGSVFMTIGRTGALGASTLIGAAASIAGSILLINPFGLFGVSIALAAGAIATMLLRLALSRRRLDYSIAPTRALGLVLAFAAVSIACYSAAEYAQAWVAIVIAILVPCACAWPFLTALRAIREIPDEIEH